MTLRFTDSFAQGSGLSRARLVDTRPPGRMTRRTHRQAQLRLLCPHRAETGAAAPRLSEASSSATPKPHEEHAGPSPGRNFYLCSPFAGWAGDSVASPLSPLGGGPRGVRSGATPTSQTSTRPGPVVRSRGPAVAAQLLFPLASVSCDLSETKAEPARDLGFAPQSVQADRVLGGAVGTHPVGPPLCPGQGRVRPELAQGDCGATPVGAAQAPLPGAAVGSTRVPVGTVGLCPPHCGEWPELDGNQVQWASSVVRGVALDTTSVHLSIHPLPALSYALDTAVTGQRSLGNLADIRHPRECCPLASDSPDDTPKL
ncbi:hypothetical protein J1605_020539 [Eschrichtius robustus]|uniref:Uncharacterized protein n=1 Tax=Eschrichtius robustus TaxID=9764 RepID=A0AB34HK14_ESCRO|nr:hypothetical protein J1605_020539 [Eschrichtius robustus]